MELELEPITLPSRRQTPYGNSRPPQCRNRRTSNEHRQTIGRQRPLSYSSPVSWKPRTKPGGFKE